MNFLFIHGGPGLNSNPERNLFKNSFSEGDKIYFWDEPKNATYEISCEDLAKTILSFSEELTVIAHSFGAFILNEVLPLIEHKLCKIILLSPVSSLPDLDRKLIQSVADSSENLKIFLNSFDESVSFSETRYNHLLIAAGSPDLAPQYWHKKHLMSGYFQYMQGDQYQFDLGNFKSIRETCAEIKIHNETEVPTEIIYGLHDPFINYEDKNFIGQFYRNSTIHLFTESAHYAHIEEMDKFLGTVVLNKLNQNTVRVEQQLLV